MSGELLEVYHKLFPQKTEYCRRTQENAAGNSL